MNTFANAVLEKTTTTLTENGAVTYSTSLNPIVDMFFHLAAKRGFSYDEIVKVIDPAFRTDAELAFRVALWVRDVREGAGERQIYRHVLRYLLNRGDVELIARAIDATLELGRTDDLFGLLETNDTYIRELVLNRIAYELSIGNGLVAKWTPRKGPINAQIRNHMGYSAKEFRKLLVRLTNVVETKMCAKQWDQINYSHVPSVAGARYRKAFIRNDGVRYGEFINRVKTGAVNPETGKVEKINTGTLYPYDITKGIASSWDRKHVSDEERQSLDVLWNNLTDFVPAELSFIPVIDTSGSMESPVGTSGVTCMDVATSLGVYLAERNKGAFKDLWMNFDTNPSWQRLSQGDIVEKIQNLFYDNWGGSTNLEAAMRLIVQTARENNVPQSDMPQFLLVLSDMEFNQWGNAAPGKQIYDLFEHSGYKMPHIVWWNIQSRNGSTPVRANDQGMALVSGFSPSIVSNLLQGEVTPFAIMMNTIMKPRYDF